MFLSFFLSIIDLSIYLSICVSVYLSTLSLSLTGKHFINVSILPDRPISFICVICPSMNLPCLIYLPHPFIYTNHPINFIHLSIYLSLYLPINPSIPPSIYPSIHPPILTSIYLFIFFFSLSFFLSFFLSSFLSFVLSLNVNVWTTIRIAGAHGTWSLVYWLWMSLFTGQIQYAHANLHAQANDRQSTVIDKFCQGAHERARANDSRTRLWAWPPLTQYKTPLLRLVVAGQTSDDILKRWRASALVWVISPCWR